LPAATEWVLSVNEDVGTENRRAIVFTKKVQINFGTRGKKRRSLKAEEEEGAVVSNSLIRGKA